MINIVHFQCSYMIFYQILLNTNVRICQLFRDYFLYLLFLVRLARNNFMIWRKINASKKECTIVIDLFTKYQIKQNSFFGWQKYSVQYTARLSVLCPFRESVKKLVLNWCQSEKFARTQGYVLESPFMFSSELHLLCILYLFYHHKNKKM